MDRGHSRGWVFAVWGALLLGSGPSLAQPETFPPQLRPAPEWLPPARPADIPGNTLPSDPSIREIEPLEASPPAAPAGPIAPTPDPALPVPPPEEPPSSASSVDWPVLFARTMRPVVLPTEEYLTIEGEAVQLREGPGLDFTPLGALRKGETVPLCDTDDDWYRVQLASGEKGWVYSGYARPVTQVPATLIGERVNLRGSPSPDSPVLGTLYQGYIVVACRAENDWTEVRTPNLGRAFVSSHLVIPIPPEYPINPPIEPYPDPPPVVASLANLTEDASRSSSYMLAVWGNEWVKGGKAGLLYFSSVDPNPLLSTPGQNLPAFAEGTFFHKTLFKKDWKAAFGGSFTFPPNTQAVTVGYLRGEKRDLVWTFEFQFQGLDPDGRFALVCQEGEHTGKYLLLQERIVD